MRRLQNVKAPLVFIWFEHTARQHMNSKQCVVYSWNMLTFTLRADADSETKLLDHCSTFLLMLCFDRELTDKTLLCAHTERLPFSQRPMSYTTAVTLLPWQMSVNKAKNSSSGTLSEKAIKPPSSLISALGESHFQEFHTVRDLLLA